MRLGVHPPQDGDRIVAAWAEDCSGPGWRNSLTYVLIANRSGEHRIEAIQVRDYDETMHEIHAFSCLATERLTNHVRHNYRWPEAQAEE